MLELNIIIEIMFYIIKFFVIKMIMNDNMTLCWLSNNNILHRDHNTKNSVTLCGRDWDNWVYLAIDEEIKKAKKCKQCEKIYRLRTK